MAISANITYATGLVNPKTTALFFDKLLVPSYLIAINSEEGSIFPDAISYLVPKELCIVDDSFSREFLFATRTNSAIFHALRTGSIRMEEMDLIKEALTQDMEEIKNIEIKNITKAITTGDFVYYRNKAIKEICAKFRKLGKKITSIYLCNEDYNEVNDEQRVGVEFCINGMSIISDEELTWEQVIELRKDKKARERMVRFKNRFTVDLSSMNKDEIIGVIHNGLDDYQWALKKFGIKTTIGGITSILSFISGQSAIQLVSNSPMASALGGVAIGSGVLAWIANRMTERTEITRDEVAFLYDIQNLS